VKLPIAFFGSGPVAAASLRLLHEHFLIEAVVTKPRAAHHRGSVPVLELAEELGLPIFTAANKSELSALMATKPFASNMAVLIDFGIIVSQDVIDAFKYGIVNSHFSLLPRLRGADPISFAILNGDQETGVSLMLLVEAMDEGPVLAQDTYLLPPDITGPALTDVLIDMSARLLRKVLPLYVLGEVRPLEQPTEGATYTRKLSKADGVLDVTKPAAVLEREVRALIEWPKSRLTLAGHDIIVTKSHTISGMGKPGEVYRSGIELGVYTNDGILIIDELKPAGKGVMTAQAFAAGYLR